MTRKTIPAIRVLLFKQGRPASVVNVEPTAETFGVVVGGEPIMLNMTDHFSMIVAKDAPAKGRGNVRVLDVGEPSCGHVAGDVFVVEHDDNGKLVSMGEASITAMRAYLESRRVGAC